MRYSANQFALLRILLGMHCLVFFAYTLPHAPRLFSSVGMITDNRFNYSYGYFPNVLDLSDTPTTVSVMVAILVLLSGCLMLGIARRTASLLLWFGIATLANRNNYFWSPGMPLVGWLLLMLSVAPLGEGWCWRRERDPEWSLSPVLYWGGWVIMAASYSISGFFKCASPSWVDGTAIAQTIQWTWARDWWFSRFMISAPAWVPHTMTWVTLFLETFCLPMMFTAWGRAIFWFGLVGMHLNIILLMDLFDLTSSVLLMHLFTYDPRWLEWLRNRTQRAPQRP